MYVDIGASGSARIQVDGKRLSVPVADTLPSSGAFSRMLVGLSTSGQAQEADFDDLRIGPKVYGCSGQSP